MFGIPLEEPAHVFYNNKGVYINASYGASTIKKKDNSIANHKTKECVANGVMFIFKEDGDTNFTDILTKALGKVKRVFTRSRIIYDEKIKILKKGKLGSNCEGE